MPYVINKVSKPIYGYLYSALHLQGKKDQICPNTQGQEILAKDRMGLSYCKP